MPNLTLLEWAKRVDPDGTVPEIANVLAQTNEILNDLVSVQGNLPTGHRVTISTGLPTVYWRSLNQGIPTSKSVTAQVDEGIAIAESRSEVDIDLAMLHGNTAAFRLQEARQFLEAMNQKIAFTLFYGNPAVTPNEFLGLTQRYNDTAAGNGQNVIKAGGAGNGIQTSIWLIGWGDNTVFCPFPKGSKAGLLQEDLGRQTSYDTGTTGHRMEVLAERFQWKIGLVVKDWRAAVRVSDLQTTLFTGLTGVLAPTVFTNVIHQMAKAIARIPTGIKSMTRLAFYMNPSVFSVLMRTALEKSSSALSVQDALDQFGRPSQMLSFLGIPIRQTDAILLTEDPAL